MGPYRVEFAASAAKEFRALPHREKQRIESAIDVLRENPRPSRVRKLRAEEDLYRIRVGSHRVVFAVDDKALLILVTRVRHRSEAYR